MTVLAAPYTVQERDLTTLEGAELRGLARLRQAFQAERFPDDPLVPLELIERQIHSREEVAEPRDWIVIADGDVIASANVTRWTMTGNPHWREAWIGVRPDHRRRGIAGSLMRRIVDACADDPEIVMGSWANDRIPGDAGNAFARRLGAAEGLNNRTSELVIAEIDRAMVREWASLDPIGYRLVWIDGVVPDELMPNVIVAYDAMNTAPRGDLAFGDWHTTADEVRDWERAEKLKGNEHRLLLAIHDATGETAGFTEVARNPLTPFLVNQRGTAVVPEHRGHGIGKWVKARMVERFLRDWPGAKVVRTGNAYVNAPMLSINDRLGFKVIFSVMAWQLRLADAKAYLEARGLDGAV